MAEIQQGTVIAGKYRVDRRLSHGGMGSVWLGYHLHLDAPVAVKFMRPSLVQDSSARSRFEREAKAAAAIRSPHVVHIYDHGVDAGNPFIVMEFLEGADLRQRLKGKRRLPPHEAARICHEMCKGLHRAHRLGIVHRDLKPGNIWLSEPDDNMVKILDFGIAKETGKDRVVKGETTTTGQLLGSPHYMSPEQARGQQLDGRSDLWSLAVILFRTLTGRRPFNGDDIGDLIVRICMDPIPRVSKFVPELTPAIDAFFDKSFQRSPDDRYQDAREFNEAFRTALGDLAYRMGPDESGSWDSRASGNQYPAIDVDVDAEAPTQMTPTPSSTGSSERFANMVGPIPTSNPGMAHTNRGFGEDTLAAATAPMRKRVRILGGAVLALVAGIVITAVVLSNSETQAPAATGEPTTKDDTEAPTPEPEKSAVDSQPAAAPIAEPTATPSASASAKVTKTKKAKPVVPRAGRARVKKKKKKVVTQPPTAPTKKPNVFGY